MPRRRFRYATGLADAERTGSSAAPRGRSQCVRSRWAGRRAPRWCKSLNRSVLTASPAPERPVLPQVFPQLLWMPADGFASLFTGDDPGCRTTADDQAQRPPRAGKSHGMNYLPPRSAPRTRRARWMRRTCGNRPRECCAKDCDHAARRLNQQPDADGRAHRRSVVARLARPAVWFVRGR